MNSAPPTDADWTYFLWRTCFDAQPVARMGATVEPKQAHPESDQRARSRRHRRIQLRHHRHCLHRRPHPGRDDPLQDHGATPQ
jgi:hypothetical protein